MHIDHDHVAGGEHSHQHAHAHTHEHPHDSHTQTHEHTHEHTPMDELLALMKYMVGHNAAHAQELAELAHQLDEAGNHAAYHRVMDAVASFDVGNATLSAVLDDLTK